MISDSVLAVSLLENNTMLFPLAITICQFNLLLFLMENNSWLQWMDVKTIHHVQVAWEIKCVSTLYSMTI